MGTRDSRLGAALRSVFARLRDERGIALIAALGTMTSLGLVVTGAVAFTSANSRNANESNAIQKAHALAEAGINNSLSILAAAYAQNIIFYGEEVDLLPQRTTTLNGGTVRWGGEYCTGTATALCTVDDTGLWRLESTGSVKNPTGPGAADAAYTLRARIPASMGPTKPANPIWSWVYSGAPQSAGFAESSCNMVIGNKTRIMSPLYVVGNLCLENQGSISQPSSVPVSQCPSTTRTDCNRLVTGGWLWQKSNQNYVGTAAGRLSEAHVEDGCGQNTGSAAVIANPCTWDSEKLYVSPSGRYTSIGSAQLTPPSFSWDDYYRIASPGPKSGAGRRAARRPRSTMTSSGTAACSRSRTSRRSTVTRARRCGGSCRGIRPLARSRSAAPSTSTAAPRSTPPQPATRADGIRTTRSATSGRASSGSRAPSSSRTRPSVRRRRATGPAATPLRGTRTRSRWASPRTAAAASFPPATASRS